MHVRVSAALLTVLVLGGGAAAEEAATAPAPPRASKPAYLTDTTPTGVADWVIKNLDVSGLTVIAARPTVSIWLAPDVDRENAPRVRFWERQEVLSANVEAELGARSLRVQKQIDCDRKIVRTLFTARYAGNNLTEFKDSLPSNGGASLITPEMPESAEMAIVCAAPKD
jgi:hypothetical protein